MLNLMEFYLLPEIMHILSVMNVFKGICVTY